jgi:ATP-binding cassette subfamily D (ALD) protein 2
MEKIFRKKLWYITIEQFLIKYVWNTAGCCIIAMPLLLSLNQGESVAEGVSLRTKAYTTGRHYLMNGADAMERIMTSYKEIVELAGYTSRAAEMFNVFREVKAGKCMMTSTVSRGEKGAKETSSSKNGDSGMDGGSHDGDAEEDPQFDLSNPGGVVTENNSTIILEDVPIITPNLDIVVPKLSLKVVHGMHLLITGPNGCGKSSLFRILGGLWPVYGGRLTRPHKSNLFYIPQRPYMSVGTLRDQVIYPDSVEKMQEKGITDEDLEDILDIVYLKYIVKREGGVYCVVKKLFICV